MTREDQITKEINATYGRKPQGFSTWGNRAAHTPRLPCPRTIIIDTEENHIVEIYEEHSPYRRDIQFVVPNLEWLKELYTLMETLYKVTKKAEANLHKHLHTAEMLEEG